MGGPGTSSDILGIEIGRDAVRGVLLDQAAAELTAAGECVMPAHAVDPDGIIDPMVVGPVLENLLTKLNIYDRSKLRVGVSIGPKNSGVGSGPAMAGWLDSQAKNLKEPLRCSGGLGVAFAPSRAVDAVVKLASDGGIELARMDFAPVAAARAIGDQIEDAMCVGSGQGWQARMRDFEVLEAMENPSVSFDAPLHISRADGQAESIARYGWVEISPQLDQQMRVDVGQLAVAVGVAIGVAYESPADLLSGKTVGCLVDRPAVDKSLQHLAGVQLTEGSESTLQLQPRQATEGDDAQRTPRQTPTTSLSPLRRAAGASVVDPEPLVAEPVMVEPVSVEPLLIEPLTAEPVSAESLSAESVSVESLSAEAVMAAAPERVEQAVQVDEPLDGRNAEWEDGLHEADPITMFSPDTEVEEMMGRRNRRLSVDIFIGLLVISLIALGVVYFVL